MRNSKNNDKTPALAAQGFPACQKICCRWGSAIRAAARIKQHLQRKCIKSQDKRLTFYTLREKKFPYRNFFSFVFGRRPNIDCRKNKVFRQSPPTLAAQGFSCAVKFPHIGIAALGMRWYNSCNRQSQDRYAALRQAAPDTVITDGGKQMKRIYRLGLGLLCAGLLAAGIPQAAAAHWADQSIDFVQEQQWIDPVSPQDFAPDAPVSRAAVVTALYRMNGAAWEQGGTVPGFADVAAEDCCADAVYWAAAHGVVNGVSETAFRPGDGITREQLAAVLQRFADVRQEIFEEQAGAGAAVFTDWAQIRPYAVESVDWAVRAGLLEGRTGGRFAPQDGCTRAELSVILERYAMRQSVLLSPQDWAAAYYSAAEETAFHTDEGAVQRRVERQDTADTVRETQTYTDAAGRTVQTGRVTARSALPAHAAAQIELDAGAGTVRRYDAAAGRWLVQPLRSGTLPRGMYFIRTETQELILVTPQSYERRENGMIEWLPAQDGVLQVAQREQGYSLILRSGMLRNGSYSDYLIVRAPAPMIDWGDPDAVSRWENYNLTDRNRWCLDGYYYLAPSTYFPYGRNYFHNQPAAYIACKMMRDRHDGASRALGLAMMDGMRRQQNEQGYIPVRSGSVWLRDSYGIAPGYFDTRWNSDLWLGMLDAAYHFGVTEWLAPAQRYADFLLVHAEERHFTVSDGVREGWLVQDYWHPEGQRGPTHTSLNHHAAEAVFLYRIAAMTGEESYAVMADRMVRGIEVTASRWIKPNHDLHYSYRPDGTWGGTDYPDLTYYDLIELQRLYTARHGTANGALTRLIASKKSWMQAQGVL